MKLFRAHYVIFFALLVSILPGVSLAHGVGASYEELIDGYIIDVGYSPEVIEAETATRLDFNLSRENSNEDVAFSHVWLRVLNGERTLFAGGIHRPEFGNAGVLYTFPEPGTYTIAVRFEHDGESIVETTFPLNVEKNQNTKRDPFFLLVVAGSLLGGGALGLVIGRRFRA